MTWDVDLQQLLDDLAQRLGVPVALEDRRFRLVAYSAHDGAADEVRTASIMAREAPPAVVRWLDSLHLERADGIVPVPENPGLHMGDRLCAPTRHRRILLGYLWVIGTLQAEQREALETAATIAAGVVWRRRMLDEERLRSEGEVVRRLLRGADEDARAAAAVQLAGEHGRAASAPVSLLVVRSASHAGERSLSPSELAEIGQQARAWVGTSELAYVVEPGQVVVLAWTADATELERIGDALLRAGAPLVGVGGARASLADAAGSLHEAELAIELIARVGTLGPVLSWGAAKSWALVWELYDGRHPQLPEQVRRLVAQPELAEAMEALLDHGGSVPRAAHAHGMHRATLHRRVQRAERLTGLRLASGDDRLVLHMGLRLWRLRAATSVAACPRDPRRASSSGAIRSDASCDWRERSEP